MMQVFNKMRIQAEFISLNMILKISQSLPKLLFTDQERLERVIFVLLQNSLKYTQQGCIKLLTEEVQPAINLERGRSMEGYEHLRVRFTVIDSGIGISEQDQRDMFQLFSNPKSVNY